MGEGAAAWFNGAEGFTNSFISSFYYADALATLALNQIAAHCRQTLVGGYYGLLNRETFAPNPDFFVAQLHHDLMGERVLRLEDAEASTDERPLRVYAHCARGRSGQVTLLLINTASHAVTVERVEVRLADGTAAHLRLAPRLEYVLDAPSLTGQAVRLNGERLAANGGKLPQLSPRRIEAVSGSVDRELVMAPLTISYFVLVASTVPACSANATLPDAGAAGGGRGGEPRDEPGMSDIKSFAFDPEYRDRYNARPPDLDDLRDDLALPAVTKEIKSFAVDPEYQDRYNAVPPNLDNLTVTSRAKRFGGTKRKARRRRRRDARRESGVRVSVVPTEGAAAELTSKQ